MADDSNATYRPSELKEGRRLGPSDAAPSAPTEIKSVCGAQLDDAFGPVQRSRTYNSVNPDAPPTPEGGAFVARFVALEMKATNLPSPLMATCRPTFPFGTEPSDAKSTAAVCGTQEV